MVQTLAVISELGLRLGSVSLLGHPQVLTQNCPYNLSFSKCLINIQEWTPKCPKLFQIYIKVMD
jgi:hypothetical protein